MVDLNLSHTDKASYHQLPNRSYVEMITTNKYTHLQRGAVSHSHMGSFGMVATNSFLEALSKPENNFNKNA